MATNKKIPLASPSWASRPLKFRVGSPFVDAPTETARVELVPMIDVIFCILIFFILAAVGFSRQQAISVDLPKASTGTAQGRKILMVSLNEFGQVFVEQQPVVTEEQFKQILQAYRQESPDGVMALYASPNASYNDVVQVLDLLRQVGGDRVALATLPGGTAQSPNLSPSLPPTTGVPGFTPYPSPPSLNPYGNLNPTDPLNPTQPQLPPYPGLPQSPGISPGIPQPSPGQTPISPKNLVTPSPGAGASPQINPTPGTATPSPGAAASPRTNSANGSP